MPTPPPFPDPSHIETRLLVVAEMLEKAVAEVRRTMADIKGEIDGGFSKAGDQKGSENTDV